MNPVILLDEIDKLGSDWRGDPSSALLEVLDPAQNSTFRDHYLDVQMDLSQVLFIATANMADQIPAALYDRLEVITLDGYTEEEKVAIAEGFLIPRQQTRNGLLPDEVTVSTDAVRRVIGDYTREAGVRSLERNVGTLLRKAATKLASGEATAPGGPGELDRARDPYPLAGDEARRRRSVRPRLYLNGPSPISDDSFSNSPIPNACVSLPGPLQRSTSRATRVPGAHHLDPVDGSSARISTAAPSPSAESPRSDSAWMPYER